jgi:hypothetical protein
MGEGTQLPRRHGIGMLDVTAGEGSAAQARAALVADSPASVFVFDAHKM